MRNVLVVCDRANLPPTLNSDRFELCQINQYPPHQNMRLEVMNISHQLLRSLSGVARDLLDIAAFVYHADNSTRRATNKDVFNEKWVREFTFVVPVREPDVWQCEAVNNKLVEMLDYLTEDRYEFVFTHRDPRPEQLVLQDISDTLPYAPEADCVALFSGGMDSLAGAANLVESGRKPILVSHQSRPVLAQLQRRLASSIRERMPSWVFPHLDVRINRMGLEAVENSQRSRSFLFLAIASLVAHELALNEVVVSENGITTFNLPRLGQTVGTLATRSTHPRFIELFRQMVSEVFVKDFVLTMPFIWMTRAEVLEILTHRNCTDLIPLSASCNHSRRPKVFPHCGTCSQCVDRRFAVTYLGLDALEGELDGYEKDIFTDELEEGEERMQAVSPVQFALDVRKRDALSFYAKYVQVFDAVAAIPGDSDQNLTAMYELHRRYADETYGVMGKVQGRNWESKYNRELPDTCLLMLFDSSTPKPPEAQVIDRAKDLINKIGECPVGENKPFEDLCEEILTFLFCEDVPVERALSKPTSQSETDQGYHRRDLVFHNLATEGFWAEVRRQYSADGIIVDPKNYEEEIGGDTVHDFSKYIKEYGLGRFGIVVGRKVPQETRTTTSRTDRTPGAIEAQKTLWRDTPHKMIVLLDEDDLREMLRMKTDGKDPSDLLRARIFTLKSRI